MSKKSSIFLKTCVLGLNLKDETFLNIKKTAHFVWREGIFLNVEIILIIRCSLVGKSKI